MINSDIKLRSVVIKSVKSILKIFVVVMSKQIFFYGELQLLQIIAIHLAVTFYILVTAMSTSIPYMGADGTRVTS